MRRERHLTGLSRLYSFKMSRKTYISINYPCLITTVEVNGTDTVVRFGKSGPSCRGGLFVTDDETLQRALETDSAYGIDYELYGRERDTAPDTAADEDSYVEVPEVHNRQTAIEWAASELSLVLPVKMSSQKIRTALAQRGYRFPRWTERSVDR